MLMSLHYVCMFAREREPSRRAPPHQEAAVLVGYRRRVVLGERAAHDGEAGRGRACARVGAVAVGAGVTRAGSGGQRGREAELAAAVMPPEVERAVGVDHGRARRRPADRAPGTAPWPPGVLLLELGDERRAGRRAVAAARRGGARRARRRRRSARAGSAPSPSPRRPYSARPNA